MLFVIWKILGKKIITLHIFAIFKKIKIRIIISIAHFSLQLFVKNKSVLSSNLLLTTILARPYFCQQLAEHDASLTSFMADPSKTRKISLVGTCEIDEESGKQSSVATSAFLFKQSKDWWRGMRFGPPTGRGLNQW